ncbi:ATP-binding protein [Chryseobacterium sp. MYb264]|uniref:sensor histidine kinase n=1 Tax=Chryseobacterium sp. MYb264 TaxID=2745153 RepID=UPI002E0D6103|nr:ATP-binding protein [Chryseobacterium sp. MYb264]
MNKKNYIRLIYIVLSIVSGMFCYHFFLEGKWINVILFALVIVVLLSLVNASLLSQTAAAEKIILSIVRKDFSLFPSEDGTELTDSSVRLYYQSKNEHFSLSSYKLLYESILDRLDIGLMILSKKESDWEVFYVNPVFLNILQVPKYNSWNLYANKIPEFFNIIEQTQYESSQEFFDISIRHNAKQSFSLRTKQVQNVQDSFYIITLESVQKIIEQKEKLAWNNLMKVISHELLNTLTPVNSLIQNLEYISNQEVVDKEDQQEMKESLAIINSKSRQLLNFVDNYRQVAELPKPLMANVSLKKITETAIAFLKQEFDKNTITVIADLEEQFVYADQKMIERCLINLFLNAIYAVNGKEEKIIRTDIQLKNNRLILSISDNGCGITDEIKDKIFLPFFTTRNSGSGIGLTLSKSIMEAHKGYLNYQNLEEGSCFEMWFVI